MRSEALTDWGLRDACGLGGELEEKAGVASAVAGGPLLLLFLCCAADDGGLVRHID
jgi:hypothetical protein